MRALCTLVLAVLSLPLLAQQVDQDDLDPAWYQVEVIIFRYLETSGETESWPALPELTYPAELQHLRGGAANVDLRQPFNLLLVEDTVPADPFELAWETPIQELLQSAEAPKKVVQPSAGDVVADSAKPAVPLDLRNVSLPRAFVPLAPDTTEFATQLQRIRNSRDMRLLFHQSWLQPVKSRDNSLPVAVDGTIVDGDYPALQGSLLLYVSRYLHVETNLWLNTYQVENTASEITGHRIGTEQETGEVEWSMPAPPLPPRAYNWSPWSFRVELPAGFSDDIVLPQEHPATGEPPTTFDGGAPVAAFDPADRLQPIVINARHVPLLDVESFLQAAWYPFQHAVLIQQKRRMRSGELHYLDHPMLGIILRVMPYEFGPVTDAGKITP